MAALLTALTSFARCLPDFSKIFNQVAPSVVNIYTEKQIKLSPNNAFEYFSQLYGYMPKKITRRSLGSGVIYSSKGYIITNYHLVANVDRVKVILKDGTELPAKMIGYDKGTDIAVLKVEGGKNLIPAKLGNSDSLKIGEWVLAIGNPFGLSYTATAGIVSAKGRIIGERVYDQFIQTDASINPGNSGGPLVNGKGEVVGINTAVFRKAQGIGFAIPINLVKSVVYQIITTGTVSRGWLGLEAKDTDKPVKGALITKVIKGGPADRAGIKRGDIIIGFNDKRVTKTLDLPMWTAETPPGTVITLKVWRKGKIIEKKVKVGRLKELNLSNKTLRILRKLGITLGKDQEGFFIKEVSPKSPAEESMLKPKDRILEINKIPVKSSNDIDRALSRAKSGDFILLRIQRKSKRLFVAVQVP